MLGRFVIVYLDDILQEPHSKTTPRTSPNMSSMFAKCSHAYNSINFHQRVESFLGYHIGPQGVAMEPDKVSAVTGWQMPCTVKELQRFLGFANFYRRFIKDFSSVASPLTDCLQPNRHLHS